MSLLEARGISVRFGGHMAVIDVDLDVESGVITGLIGPNGAGKTTTFNALCGMLDVSAGRVLLDGQDITRIPPHQRARRGLARTFQRIELFGSLTTRENLQVAAEYRAGIAGTGGDPERQVAEVLAFVGLEPIAEVRADALSTGQARLVELARALVIRPKVLLLDEPASGLDVEETADFTRILRSLVESGLGILLVDHDMPLVMSTCSRVYVLDFGKLIASGTPEEVKSSQVVLDAYLGTPEGAR